MLYIAIIANDYDSDVDFYRLLTLSYLNTTTILTNTMMLDDSSPIHSFDNWNFFKSKRMSIELLLLSHIAHLQPWQSNDAIAMSCHSCVIEVLFVAS